VAVLSGGAKQGKVPAIQMLKSASSLAEWCQAKFVPFLLRLDCTMPEKTTALAMVLGSLDLRLKPIFPNEIVRFLSQQRTRVYFFGLQ
tara:strand:- start:84 stop:347 length:264 start_codon:yes stop_codon:yes gene_type:complete